MVVEGGGARRERQTEDGPRHVTLATWLACALHVRAQRSSAKTSKR